MRTIKQCSPFPPCRPCTITHFTPTHTISCVMQSVSADSDFNFHTSCPSWALQPPCRCRLPSTPTPSTSPRQRPPYAPGALSLLVTNHPSFQMSGKVFCLSLVTDTSLDITLCTDNGFTLGFSFLNLKMFSVAFQHCLQMGVWCHSLFLCISFVLPCYL